MQFRHDTVFNLALSAALAFVLVMFLLSCGAPRPDLDAAPRGAVSREVSDSEGRRCRAYLPLVVRSSYGQRYVKLALEAAQPWADALGYALAVPAMEGERETLSIIFAPCPEDYVDGWDCKRWAATSQACDGAVYRQTIELYGPASARELVLVLEHELGHALGADLGSADIFGHSSDESSIMFKNIDTRPGKRTLTPLDGTHLRSAWR